MTFRTTLLKAGGTATGIEIPPDVVAALGSTKRPPVKVTINRNYTYRSTVAVMGGKFMVGVAAEHRKGAGVAGGDVIDVTLELDTEPRTVEVPSDLARAFTKNKAAKAAFDKLAYTHRKEYVRAIQDAKKPETRQRRIEKTIESLGG